MNIVSASCGDEANICSMIEECKKNMIERNIDQWNPFYPNIDIITKDIEEGKLFKIEEQGRPMAIITLNEMQDPEYSQVNWTITEGRFLIVHRLAVHPSAQSKGIARGLMQFAEVFASDRGYSALRLDAYSGNSRALSLYESLGYKRTGIVHFPMRSKHFYCYEKAI